MRFCNALALLLGMILIAGNTSKTFAAKSAKGNEWNWAADYPELNSPYGQSVVVVGVKYVVTPASVEWTPNKVEYEVHLWAKNDGTGWDSKHANSFTTDFSSEHPSNPIAAGNGAKYFNVRNNKCTFLKAGDSDIVPLEDSGYVQFRN